VVASPGEGELAGADHAHGGAQVRDPDGGLGAQGSPDVRNHVGGLRGEGGGRGEKHNKGKNKKACG